MTSEEVRSINENKPTRRNGNPHLYPDTLYIGGVYKSESGGPPAGSKPFVLVETGLGTQEYLLINLHDGMPARIGGASKRGYLSTGTEGDVRRFLAKADMKMVGADAETYYTEKDVEDIEGYVKAKKM